MSVLANPRRTAVGFGLLDAAAAPGRPPPRPRGPTPPPPRSRASARLAVRGVDRLPPARDSGATSSTFSQRRSSSRSRLYRRALAACRFSVPRCFSTSNTMSSMRVRFCCAASSFSSAARRRALVLRDAGRLLDQLTPIGRARAQNHADLALLDDRVGLGAEPGVHQQLVDVPQPADLAVDQVFALAGTVQPSRHLDVAGEHAPRRDAAIGRCRFHFRCRCRCRGRGRGRGHSRCRRTPPDEIPRNRVAPAGGGIGNPVRRSRTSAVAPGLRASLPLKITSSMRSPRRLLALCSPSTHVMASATLLLPHPFGPTIAVTPWSKASSERSENDLNP